MIKNVGLTFSDEGAYTDDLPGGRGYLHSDFDTVN